MASSTESPSLSKLASARDVLQILECPVCLNVMSTPVYQCVTGHSICNICKPKLTQCPLCKRKLSGARNFVVEDIISSSLHKCIYKADGCTATAKKDLIKEHIKTCSFRPSPCPLHSYDNCEGSFKNVDILQHLKLIHKVTEKSSHQSRINFTSSQNPTQELLERKRSHILQRDKSKFLVCALSSRQNMYWAIMLIGDGAHEGRYSGEVTLHLDDKRYSRWKFPILSTLNRTVRSYVCEELGCTAVYPKENMRVDSAKLDSGKWPFKVLFEILDEDRLEPTQPQSQKNKLRASLNLPSPPRTHP